MDRIIQQKEKRLGDLFSLGSKITDQELQSHWAKYLCVLVSGFIDEGVKTTLCSYAREKSESNIANYIDSKFERVTNLKEERIKALLGDFSPDWRSQWARSVSEEQKLAIDSVVNNRHKIAHGGSSDITFREIKAYFEKIKQVVRIVDNIIK